MNMFVGSAAVAGATALSHQPAAASSVVMDVQQASQELRDLVTAVHEADEVLKAKQTIYDEAYDQYRAWAKINPEPRVYGHRAYRKWENRHDKFMTSIGFFDAQEAHRDALVAHREARMAAAKFESRDLNDVALKAAAAVAFETHKGMHESIISQGITLDVMRMMVVAN
jgi:hypothetical protein